MINKQISKQSDSIYRWESDGQNIRCLSGSVKLFEDSLHHWQNAVLRLPHQTDQEAKNWLEASFTIAALKTKRPSGFSLLSLDEKVLVLELGWKKLYPKAKVIQNKSLMNKAHVGTCGHKANYIYANMVDSNQAYAVVGCSKCKYGWLVNAKNPQLPLKSTVDYEEEYFEGGTNGLGYGHYLEQEGWRIAKAYGQVRQIKAAAEFLKIDLGKHPRLLDVGSGYGFLRKAAADAGWRHDGIDTSNYAAKIAKQEYGFNTFIGLLADFILAHKKQRYDVIVLADVIEHVRDPISELKTIKQMLTPNGFCMIRTPNIMAIEREVFSNLFYSLKSEHLHYFSPRAISLFAEKVGLAARFNITQSHFFAGALGQGIRIHETDQQGSDIFAILQNQ